MYQLSKVRWRIALPVMAVLLVGIALIYGVRSWRAHKAKDPLSELGPGVYQPARASYQGETLSLPSR
jgi:hypothetical protein